MKRKASEKEVTEVHPGSPTPEKDNTSASNPPTPLPSLVAEAEKIDMVETAKVSSSIVPGQSLIPASDFKEKFSKIYAFCCSMKVALLEQPLEFGSDIVSQNTNCYRDQAEVSERTPLVYNFILSDSF